MMDQTLIKALHKLESDNIVSQVKSVILEQLSCGKVTEEDISGHLNMSKRKLQLKLADENVRFKSLLDDIRSNLSKGYLNEQNLCLSEIAFLLGFSEVSSFSRAFKRWTGVSPGQYKKMKVCLLKGKSC
jgi:AraC-like DNA-binding protein